MLYMLPSCRARGRMRPVSFTPPSWRLAPAGALAARRMVLPIEAYIDTCSRHNEQPLEAIATALSSEASVGLRIANLKLVPPLTPSTPGSRIPTPLCTSTQETISRPARSGSGLTLCRCVVRSRTAPRSVSPRR